MSGLTNQRDFTRRVRAWNLGVLAKRITDVSSYYHEAVDQALVKGEK